MGPKGEPDTKANWSTGCRPQDELQLQDGGVSDETVKYGREFCGTLTQEWLLWQGPEAIVQVNYRPVLSSERALQNNKATIIYRKFQGERKIGHGSQMSAWHQDWLADWLSNVP
jgi:hypothetical protein